MVFNIKKVLFGIAFMLVVTFFVIYGIETFYPSPVYDDYCAASQKPYPPEGVLTEEGCAAFNGTWQRYDGKYYEKPVPVRPVETNATGFCDLYSTCSELYNNADQEHRKVAFIIASIIGLALVLGGLALKNLPVSGGGMAAGIILIFYGTVPYWGELAQWLRFAILGVLLVVLIWVGYKKFG